jgi:hypothetical protein
MEPLRPCPCCGGVPAWRTDAADDVDGSCTLLSIRCMRLDCGVRTPGVYVRSSAEREPAMARLIETWNRRVPTDAEMDHRRLADALGECVKEVRTERDRLREERARQAANAEAATGALLAERERVAQLQSQVLKLRQGGSA